MVCTVDTLFKAQGIIGRKLSTKGSNSRISNNFIPNYDDMIPFLFNF